MALETLKDLQEINGVKLYQVLTLGAANRADADGCYIHVYHDKNKIQFQLQQGPIKENGVNGCQVDDMLHVARKIISELNKKYPCRENSCAITKIDEAIMWLKERTADRETRGVEGTNQE